MRIGKKYKTKTMIVCSALYVLCLTAALFPAKAQTKIKAEPSNLFDAGANTTITSNVEVPVYAQEGFYANGENDYATKETLPAWRTNGVLVTTKSEMETVEFKNIIDLNALSENTRLISLLPLSSDRYNAYDFTTFEVRLTDADDPTNWFAIHTSTLGYNDLTVTSVRTHFYLSSSKYQLKPNLGERRSSVDFNAFYGITRLIDWKAMDARDNALIAEGKQALGESECIFYHEMQESLVKPYSFYYDPNTKCVSFDNHIDNKVLMYDLDDPAKVGEGNEFEGFKNNRVKLSIRITGMKQAIAKYMILNVAGYGMNGESVEDTMQPSYLENLPLYKGKLPVAMVNKEYPLFDVDFYDIIDGAVEPKIYVKAPRTNTYEALSENKFTPLVAGVHSIRYEATDRAGNTCKVDYDVIAKTSENMEALSVSIDSIKTDYDVGEVISIPGYTAKGGSGEIFAEYEVVRLADGKKITINNDKFIPRFAGMYEIKYTVRDYLNMVATRSVCYNVTDRYSPILESDIVMYKKLVSGVTTELPKVNAYDYTLLAGQRMNATTEITVKGQGSKANVVEKLTGNVFTPSIEKFGEHITIEYKVYCAKYPENAMIIPFEVEIYEPSYIYEYFTYAEDEILVTPNEKNEKATTFTALQNTGNASFAFINPLRAEYFEVNFSVAKGNDYFDKIKITLTDSFNKNNQVELFLEKYTAIQSKLIYNNQTVIVKGGIGVNESSIGFYYSNGALYETSGAKLIDLEGFEGFSEGKLWAEISMLGVYGSSAIKMSKIGTQALSVRYRTDSQTGTEYAVKFSDTLAPEIEVVESVVSDAVWGTKVQIPYARAYDVCSQYVTVSFTLIDPDGELLYENANVDYNCSFNAEKYGTYVLIYIAKDQKGVSKELTYNIDVYDLGSPVIGYSGEKVIELKVGQTYKIQDVVVYDAVDENPKLRVFVRTSDYQMSDVTDSMEYTFTKKGKYVIRYFAYDSSYNVSYVEVIVYVK